VRKIKKETKESIKCLLIIVCVLLLVSLAVFKLMSYADYAEEHSYELEEIRPETYAICNTVSYAIDDKYEVITICYNGKIHVVQGIVNIHETSDKPYADIISKPHRRYSDEITIYVPKGTVEFAEGVGVR
jgi:hypothetical protein